VCFESESRALAPWRCLHFIITACQEFCDELSHQKVLNYFAEEEINVFDYELEELISCMKCQVLEILLPFISFMHGFFLKRS
jgi:hypothetical protein